MNNMRAWGGPLDRDWRQGQRDLQARILQRMREFGMWPVLPGFSGRVPDAVARVFPGANITHNGLWGNFNATYSGNALLQPGDPLFAKLGQQWYSMLTQVRC